ncbi:MAG: glycosyltransferase, partial [Pseudomonadales bacterium]|nr:glycosyltransferase [Pseudomonadales bacterium]
MATKSKPIERCQLSLIAIVPPGHDVGADWCELFQDYSEVYKSDFELVLVCYDKQHEKLQDGLAGFSFVTWSVIAEADVGYGEQVETALTQCSSPIVGLLPGADCFLSANVVPHTIRLINAFPKASVIVPSYSLNPGISLQQIENYDFFQDKNLQPAGWSKFQELPGSLAPVFFNKRNLQDMLASFDFTNTQTQLEFHTQLRQQMERQASAFLLSAEAAVAKDWQTYSELKSTAIIPRLFGQFGRQVHTALHKTISETVDADLPNTLQSVSGSLLIEERPKLSLIVIAYDMQQQLPNTIVSLSADYQLGIEQSDFEVLLIENNSDHTLSHAVQQSLPSNFYYYLREEVSRSPAAAINFGLSKAKGEYVGLMIDGAHMLTPGVLHHALCALQLSEQAFITVPTYHLGPDEQHVSTQQGFDEQQQQELLDAIDWKPNGYTLFSISSLCGANPRGFLAPIMESNCYFANRKLFAAVGGADESYQQPGGGSLNLDLVRKLGTYPEADYICLLGEGSFHQFHGGVTSNQTRAEYADGFKDELHARWGQQYHFLERNPLFFGSITRHSRKYLEFSSYRMLKRFDNFKDRLDQV